MTALTLPNGLTTAYSYDALNRLTGVSTGSAPSGSEPSGFVVVSLSSYDGEGKRVSVTEGGVTTTYLYDGLLPVLERTGSSTAVNVCTPKVPGSEGTGNEEE